jgi:hypothetical protein
MFRGSECCNSSNIGWHGSTDATDNADTSIIDHTNNVDTPSVEKYTHVSMSSSRSIFTDTNWIWSHVGFFGCGGIGSIGS